MKFKLYFTTLTYFYDDEIERMKKLKKLGFKFREWSDSTKKKYGYNKSDRVYTPMSRVIEFKTLEDLVIFSKECGYSLNVDWDMTLNKPCIEICDN